MKHAPAQYAQALFEALKDKPEREQSKVLRRFKELIRKNGDAKLQNAILTRYEKVFLKENGMRKVEIESAAILSEKTKREVENIFGSKILLTEKVDENVLAGLSILVDDTTLIDATGRTRIKKLFA